MVDFLTSWAEQLIIALIIIIMIEMILPNSSYRKYIKIVLGIFVMFVLFSPILGAKFNEIDFNKEIEKIENSTNQINGNTIDINYDKQIEIAYKEKLKETISEDLESKGYKLSSIETDIKYKNEEIKIEKLAIKIKRLNKEDSSSVEKVVISKEDSINQEEINNLKKDISTLYNIEESKISIESEI